MKRGWCNNLPIKRERSNDFVGSDRKRKRSRRHGYTLAVSELPENVFVKKNISLQVWVKDIAKNCIMCVDGVYITVELLHDDGTRAENSLLEVHTNPIIAKKGRAIVDLSLMGLSMNHENRSFKLRLHTTQSIGEIPIEFCESKSFKVIRRVIEIIEQPSGVWYKDEGGKHAHLVCKYHLLDGDGSRIESNKKIKIVPSLLYDNGERVPKKKPDGKQIFRLLENTELRGAPKGTRIVRWRVEDVSRAHGLQKFKVHLQPDTNNPNSFDIAAAYTDPTEVKSKRKTQVGSKRNKGPAGMVTQASILQHMDASLTRWLKPLGERVTRIEHSIQHLKQKIDRIEHHLGIAPEGIPAGFPYGNSINSMPSIQATNASGGFANPSQLLPSPSTIGTLPPNVRHGGPHDLPGLNRSGSITQDHHKSTTGRLDASSLPPLPIPPFADLPPAVAATTVMDLTGKIPPISQISRQKSQSGYPAFQADGSLAGFFQTSAMSSAMSQSNHESKAVSLSFHSPKELGIDPAQIEEFERTWREAQKAGHDQAIQGDLANIDPGLMKTKLIRRISGADQPSRASGFHPGNIPISPQGQPAQQYVSADADFRGVTTPPDGQTFVSNSRALDRAIAQERNTGAQ